VLDCKKEFNFDLSKSYLTPKENIIHDNSRLRNLLSLSFDNVPDILNEVKLQYAVIRSHCLQKFNIEFMRNVIDSHPTNEEYKEYKWRVEYFNEDSYEEWTSFHTQTGWRKLGYKVKDLYLIEGLEDVFIVSDGKHYYDYVIQKGDKVSKLCIPGEFVGTGDFLWVQSN